MRRVRLESPHPRNCADLVRKSMTTLTWGLRVDGLEFRVDDLGLRFWYVRVCCKRVREMGTHGVIIVHLRERVQEQNSEVQVFRCKHLHLRVALVLFL